MRITVTSGKGGTGKSTVATSLALESSRSKKTLLVDCDVECPNDHLMLSAKIKRSAYIYQMTPKWDFDKCVKCGRCAEVCKQESIVFVKGKNPAFVKDKCIGCGACVVACPQGAISKSKRPIGKILEGDAYGLHLISGELNVGELASGEVVAEVRKYAEVAEKVDEFKNVFIDSAAGIGCPVIASLVGTDYVVAVTEPTPSALHDMNRVLHVARHFGISCGIAINKSDIHKGFCEKIERYANKESLPIIGRIPYRREFVDSAVSMKPIAEMNPEYEGVFLEMLEKIIILKGGTDGKQ